jgi:signal transduction histidine kinase
VREVARSEPQFRRRLLYAWILFFFLFVADLFMVGQLAFRDLSHTMIDRAFKASLEALETQTPAPTVADPDDSAPAAPLRVEDCPPGNPQTPAWSDSCRQAPARRDPFLDVFGTIYRWQRVVTDTQGRVLWRGFGQGSRLEAIPRASGPAWHPEARGEWEVGNRRQEIIAVRQPAGPSGDEIREIGIPRELIDRELAQLQKDLQTKLWVGAGIAVLLLLVAFLYVLRLMHRARLLEAQAQRADRVAHVGALAAGLAHEIRNPLNVLSMNLQMLEEEIVERQGGEAGEIRMFLSTLQGEIRRLSNLVNNFLTYARPNQPRFETKDLNGILRELCVLVRPEFEAGGLTLRQELSPYMPPVDLDEAQIRQAVMNILHNASQILKPGGVVTVESRIGPQGEAIVAIEDDGPGIKPEDRQKIFEVFYSGRGGGTGLGLPIAARILADHGGSLTVDSRPGKGARFVLTLPRRHAATGAPAGAGALAASERP